MRNLQCLQEKPIVTGLNSLNKWQSRKKKHLFLDIQIKKIVVVIRIRGYETLGRKTKKGNKKTVEKKTKGKEKEATLPVHNLIKPLLRPFRAR